MLFACVAKCMQVQVKHKEGSQKVVRAVRLSEVRLSGLGPDRWWMRGAMATSVAERVLKLLHDMSEVGTHRRTRRGSETAAPVAFVWR